MANLYASGENTPWQDHWVAFFLLAIIGGRRLDVSLTGDSVCPVETVEKLNPKELLLLSIAIGIDALTVGITLASEPLFGPYASSHD